MLPVLLRILGVTIGGLILHELFRKEKKVFDGKANAHNQFLKFEQAISLSKVKKQKLVSSRQALQKRVLDYFRNNTGFNIPKFYIQGSFKMQTIIVKHDGTYDVDLGVYFLKKPDIEPLTLQKYIHKAVYNHTQGGAQHRDKCIRVIYSGDFNIDLPVYYKEPESAHPFLATKSIWQESDPKELCDWFEEKRMQKDRDGQILRLVKYFKAWADYCTRKMPSGIAFTVWVAEYYSPNSRDDIAFYKTAKAIKESIWWDITCMNPATPEDDLVSKLDNNQKNNFKESLEKLIEAAEKALSQKNTIDACKIWRGQLGDKFPIS